VDTVASYDDLQISRLLSDSGIVRNRKKIEAVIYNACRIIELRRQFGSFAAYLASLDIIAMDKVRREFSARFQFMGPTVTESFLQTVGILPVAHEPQCWLYETRGQGPGTRD
jgi:DNA-3-methyladenine glycosylase I